MKLSGYLFLDYQARTDANTTKTKDKWQVELFLKTHFKRFHSLHALLDLCRDPSRISEPHHPNNSSMICVDAPSSSCSNSGQGENYNDGPWAKRSLTLGLTPPAGHTVEVLQWRLRRSPIFEKHICCSTGPPSLGQERGGGAAAHPHMLWIQLEEMGTWLRTMHFTSNSFGRRELEKHHKVDNIMLFCGLFHPLHVHCQTSSSLHSLWMIHVSHVQIIVGSARPTWHPTDLWRRKARKKLSSETDCNCNCDVLVTDASHLLSIRVETWRSRSMWSSLMNLCNLVYCEAKKCW